VGKRRRERLPGQPPREDLKGLKFRREVICEGDWKKRGS